MTPPLVRKLREAREAEFTTQYKLRAGDQVRNYSIGDKLGSGRFATVWKGVSSVKTGGADQDHGHPPIVAIKAYRSGRSNQEYWRNEVKILNILAERLALEKIVSPNIITYYGTFAEIKLDENLYPDIHPCIVFGLAGQSTSKLMKWCRREHGAGVPLDCVKKIARDLFTGLRFVHAAGIVHTDIKPSNLLLDRRIETISGLHFNALIGDFGSSTTTDELFSMHVGTVEYIAPELILEQDYSFPCDIWASCATIFELITCDRLFDVYHDDSISYGSDVDEEALEGLKPSSSDDDDCNNAMSISEAGVKEASESSGSDDEEQTELISYRHLLLIAKILGWPPKAFAARGRKYYNHKGKLKNNPMITPISLTELLKRNYELETSECMQIESFLSLGLTYDPNTRATAEQMLAHKWLQF